MSGFGICRWGLAVLLCVFPCRGQEEPVPACDTLRSSELAQSARSARQTGKISLAIAHFREALATCPQNGQLQLELGEALLAAREVEEAIRVLRSATGIDPSPRARLMLANAYFMAQRWDDSLKECEAVLKRERNLTAALKLKANLLYLMGDFPNAEQIFLTVIERAPEDLEATYMMGRIYYQEGRVEQAMGLFLRVLRADPKAYKAYDNLGLCYEALNQPEEAIRHFLASIKLVETAHPEYDWPYGNLANLLINRGDLDQGFSAAVKAAKRNPRSARNAYLAGKALAKLELPDLALKWLERSAELDPNYSEALYLLGQTYRKVGQKEKSEEAMKRFQQVRAAQPAQRK
jgi:tetratricopeptide (TPR) repeat protein